MIPNILLYALLIALVPDSFGAQILFYEEPLKVKSGVCCIEQTAKPDSIQCYSVDIKGKQNLVLITTDTVKIKTTETLLNKSTVGNTIKIKGQENLVTVKQDDKNNKVTVSQNGNNNTAKVVQSNHQP